MPPSQRLSSRPRRSFIKGAAALGVTAGVTAGVAPFAIGKPTPT